MSFKSKILVNPNLLTLPLTALVVFLLSHWAVLQKMSMRWANGDNNYCYLIVPLFLYLLWDKHDRFQFNRFSWNPLGHVALLFSTGLVLLGEIGSVETVMYIGIWGCVAAVMLTLYGERIRHLVFPLLVLLFAVPLSPFINRMLTFQLKLAASALASGMLRLSGVSVHLNGNIIDLGITQLQVVDACSGLRYLMPLLLLALVVGYFFSSGWWRRAILIVLVIPLSVAFNAFRIWLMGILTKKGYHELAENLFHDVSGWMIFMMAGAILYGVTVLLKRIGSNPGQVSRQDPGPRAVGRARPIVLTAILCLIFIGSGWLLGQIPSARNLPLRTGFKAFPTQIGDWTGHQNYLSEEIEGYLWADDYVSATFANGNAPNKIFLFIPFYAYQGTHHAAHAPQACLLGDGWALNQSAERHIRLNQAESINIMSMTLQKGDDRLLGTYFFFQRGRVITSPWLNKFYLIWDSFTKRRTDGALVRIEMVVAQEQTMEDAWPVLEKFIRALWPILPDYVPL